MSRIGKKSIKFSKNIIITLKNDIISVQGPYGILEKTFLNFVQINIFNNELTIKLLKNDVKSCQYYGLIRSLINNMIIGVETPYSKILILEGIGYKFQIQSNELILNVGFTHTIKFLIPIDLSVILESNTKLLIKGIDKEKVGLFASKIHDIRPPEPYKGKGIFYNGEIIIRKVGKTGK